MSSFVPGAVGENKPILKCNAKSGRFTVDDVSVVKIQFIADLENARAGWLRFGENISPDFRTVPVKDLLAGKPYPTMPDVRDKDGKPLYRKGFVLMVKIGDKLAGDKPTIRELATNSHAVTTALDGLMRDWYDGNRESGKLPVVSVSEWKEIPGRQGSNYQPQFTILKLVNRPVDLAPEASADNGPSPHLDDVPGEPEMIDEDAPEDFGEFEAA